MDDEHPLETILALIAEHGPMDLEGLLDRLAGVARPAIVASAFQSARADRLIERDSHLPRRDGVGRPDGERGPRYRLTAAGHARAGTPALSVDVVLRVVQEFGEASAGLVAWELFVNEAEVLRLWNEAHDRALLEYSGTDPLHREPTARLTDLGREQLEMSDEMPV